MKFKFILAFCMAASFLCGDEYQFLGKHFIASYSGCDAAALKDVGRLEEVMLEAVEKTGATTLSSSKHIFLPDGLTMVVLLGESHASIHTYPEHGSCFVDLFTCGDHCHSENFDQHLRNYLHPATVNQKVMIRHENIEDDE